MPLDGFALMSYASFVEPLRAANLLSKKNLYEVVNAYSRNRLVRSSVGLTVECELHYSEIKEFDLFLIVAGGSPESFADKKLFAWISKQAQHGKTLGGVSGGPIVLVKAGVMANKRMTIHWEHAESISAITDTVLLERSLYVIDRERMTCAGGTAPMDMVLALIKMQHGQVFAQYVSDWFLHTEIRPSEGPQRGGLSERFGTTNSHVLGAIELMQNHLSDTLTLEQLASLVDISTRQLNRMFMKTLGKTTMSFYRELKLEKSKVLLRNGRMSISEVSEGMGFSNPSHFSNSFTKLYGYSPKLYRM